MYMRSWFDSGTLRLIVILSVERKIIIFEHGIKQNKYILF